MPPSFPSPPHHHHQPSPPSFSLPFPFFNNLDDNLYHDYAAKQAQKIDRNSLSPPPSRSNQLIFAAAGFGIAKLHSRSKVSKMKKAHAKDQKSLYTQYYNDVYKMQETINEYAAQAEQYRNYAVQVQEQAELDSLQRDYEEFKQPDIDGDDRISRAEFNMYVKNYLANYPGLAEKDYPRFEDFDHDRDGFVSFTEYAQQMALQVQQAEWDVQNGGGTAATQRAAALSGLSGETQKAQHFNDLYAGYR